MNKQDMAIISRIIVLSEQISDGLTGCAVLLSSGRDRQYIRVTYTVWSDPEFSKIVRQIDWCTITQTLPDILQYLEQIHAAEPRMEQAA